MRCILALITARDYPNEIGVLLYLQPRMDGWMKWGFTSFIFAQDRLIRTARDHSNEVKCTHGTE